MNSDKRKYESIDDYIKIFPKYIQDALETIRQTIQKAAPETEEVISYQIPTFKLNGNLVHFAGWKNQIAFYPTSSAFKIFSKELCLLMKRLKVQSNFLWINQFHGV